MNGTGNICSIGFRDDRSPPYWPHLNTRGRGDISLGRQIASPLDSMRSPPLPFPPSRRVFPITGARVSSLYKDRCQPPSSNPLRLSGLHMVPRVRERAHVRTCKRKDAI